jgi:Na+-transporting NADH:ubiquinone oxidoreductase subunit NqrF
MIGFFQINLATVRVVVLVVVLSLNLTSLVTSNQLRICINLHDSHAIAMQESALLG